MQITLFGGAFDPPHLAHLEIARSLLRAHLADEVWFLPVNSHAFAKPLSSSQTRLAMLRKMIEGEPQMRVEAYELQQAGTNFTEQTLQALRAQYPADSFSFVIGSDNLKNFHKWHDFESLLQNFPVFVYPREGYPLTPLYPNMTVIPAVKPVTISSSQIRTAVANNQSFSSLVTPKVGAYITSEQLYHTAKETHGT